MAGAEGVPPRFQGRSAFFIVNHSGDVGLNTKFVVFGDLEIVSSLSCIVINIVTNKTLVQISYLVKDMFGFGIILMKEWLKLKYIMG